MNNIKNVSVSKSITQYMTLYLESSFESELLNKSLQNESIGLIVSQSKMKKRKK